MSLSADRLELSRLSVGNNCRDQAEIGNLS